MTRGLADTSLFIATESGRELDGGKVPDELAVSMVTYGELRLGVLAATDAYAHERRLATLLRAAQFELVPVDERVADAWAALLVRLKAAGRSMKANDSWIAATALSLGVPVVTQDSDFDGVPGLDVLKV